MNKTPRIPDFFIVGAPKCGTTALADYLGQHPDIFIPDIKEPFFFGSDLVGRAMTDAPTYRRLFERAGQRLAGEGTVWYLRSTVAPAEIYDHNPHARIIAMLRNPIEMAYSLHNQMVYNLHESIHDFTEALRAEPARRRGEQIPARCRHPYGLLYTDVARYSEQLKRYYATFPANQIRVIVYDDFKADPLAVYRDTLRFLGGDPSFTPRMRVVNASKRLRSRFVKRWLQDESAHRLARLVVPAQWRPKVAALIDRLNAPRAPRPPMSRQAYELLADALSDEVKSLSAFLDRDLTHWLDSVEVGRS